MPEDEMTLAELKAFIAAAPFRHVKDATHGNPDSQMDPHEYIIGTWEWVDLDQFWRFVNTIERHGYRGRYQARYSDRAYTHRYLEIDDRVYWFIRPFQLCRTLIEYRQHTPIDKAISAEEALRRAGARRIADAQSHGLGSAAPAE